MKSLAPLVMGAAAMLAGCVSNPVVPHRPARINHIVLVKLHDPGQADTLVREADATIGLIPTVSSYVAGRHFDFGRPEVQTDYDVGIYVGFLTPEDYQAYLVHPWHTGLVDRWKPQCESLRIYDVLDDTP
jgi:hypothetical protein